MYKYDYALSPSQGQSYEFLLNDADLEVGRAGREDHLVRLAGLSVTGERDIGEGLLVAEVLERRDHVGLEVVPPQAELLLVSGRHVVCCGGVGCANR